MPEIGDQLRETRMRQRIDITEVEAATKIRAKYLRALENEEWDLLPGPTFVKTFLRTYADYLGLDARNLVEQYRLRYERPAASELTPFGTNLGSRRSRAPRRPVVAPWMLVLVVLVAMVGILFVIGQLGGDDEPGEREAAAPTATPQPGGGGRRAATAAARRRRSSAEPTRVRVQIVPTGPVSVCLENAAGEPLIGNLTLDVGPGLPDVQGQALHARPSGPPAATMKVDGKAYPVSAEAPDRLRAPARQAPARAARVRAADLLGMSVRAGIVVTGHRGALGHRRRPQRPVALRAAARARRRGRAHRRGRRPPGGRARRAGLPRARAT